jgi:DNA-binding GntR family transcriptional regulator
MAESESAAARHPEIAQYYRSLITSGEMGPDEKLPPISKIAEAFKVAPATANKAIKTLVDEELVRSTPAGTFVSPPVYSISPANRATNELNQGEGLRWQEVPETLTAGMVDDAPGYVLAMWGLEDGTPIGRREAVYTYRGVTEELVVSWHPPHIVAQCPELIEPEIIQHGTLHLAVDRLGRWDQLISGKDAMRGRRANAREAGLLHIAEGDPVLAVVGDRHDGHGMIEYVECVYPEHKILQYVWTWQRQR